MVEEKNNTQNSSMKIPLSNSNLNQNDSPWYALNQMIIKYTVCMFVAFPMLILFIDTMYNYVENMIFNFGLIDTKHRSLSHYVLTQ